MALKKYIPPFLKKIIIKVLNSPYSIKSLTKKYTKKFNKGKNKFVKGLSVPINLSIHACDHCNLNCVGCTPYSPLAPEAYCDLKQLEESLKVLSGIEKSLGIIKIVGGEPLLNPELSRMMELLRHYLPKKEIIVWTNGLNLIKPEKTPADFWETCRRCNIGIWITKYPINFDYESLENLLKEKGVRYQIPADRSIRWTIMQHCEKGNGSWLLKSKILKSWKCPSFNCLHLHEDKIFACAQVTFVKFLNNRFGTKFQQKRGDYVKIEKLKTPWQLRKLILFSTPFCRYCGARYQKHDWHVSRRERNEWLQN